MTTIPLTVVSAACGRYARCLWQLLRSAERQRWVSQARFVAYDLGMSAEQRRGLDERFPWCELRAFDFASHPPHVALSARRYAWKPIIVAEVLREVAAEGGQLLWLDSATILKAGPGEVRASMREFGVYTLAGQSPLSDRADPATLRALAVEPELLSWPERAAGVVGFDSTHPVARELVAEWRRGALHEPFLGPELSERHKPEQQLLSVLLFRRVAAGQLRLNPGEIDVSSYRPARWMSTRNKVEPGTPEWLDAWVRLRLAACKGLDRLWLRWKGQLEPFLDGARRWPRDHYQVYLRVDGRDCAVPAPGWSYYADPFLWQESGRTWLFVEEYQYGRSRGRLMTLEVEARAGDRSRGSASPVVRVLRRDPVRAFAGHASFPLPFTERGVLYLLPETSGDGVVDLYRCEAMPDRWVRVQRLLRDVDAADSVPLWHAGRFWLITSLHDADTAEGRYLGLFSSADLLAADWEPHPINAERRSHRPDGTMGRNAGGIVRDGERLLRPVQVTPDHYGEDMALMEITELTRERFEERPYRGGHPIAALLREWSAHHASQCGELIAFDVRDRVRCWDGLSSSWLPHHQPPRGRR
jgi:hypothetical protein